MFESEFAKTEYIERDHVVFHVWKKEAHFDDYRDPVKASLEMLREHEGSLFVVDARHGFEDVKEDVEWGFNYFLPELKKTGCTIWGFILPKVSEIEGEIDLWTKEIEKNFRVIPKPSSRAIAGLSMGGGHTISASNLYPELFDYICPLSAAGSATPEQVAALKKAGVKLYFLACGSSDFLFEGSKALDKTLTEQGLEHTFFVSEGGHTWANWRLYLNTFAPLLFK